MLPAEKDAQKDSESDEDACAPTTHALRCELHLQEPENVKRVARVPV